MSEAARDPELEFSFLANTPPAFRDRVFERLAVLGSDLPEHRTLAELLGEAREECEDIAGWLTMVLQVAKLRLPPEKVTELRRELLIVTELASAADEILAVAADCFTRPV